MTSAISQSKNARLLLQQLKELRVELNRVAPDQKPAIRRRIAGLRIRWRRSSQEAMRALERELAALRASGVRKTRGVR